MSGRIPAAVLGATGMVGQNFIRLLAVSTPGFHSTPWSPRSDRPANATRMPRAGCLGPRCLLSCAI